VVLGVLAQVTVAERDLDVLDILRPLDLLDALELVAEHLEPGGRHGETLSHRSNLEISNR
jgi:hypothetical protein